MNADYLKYIRESELRRVLEATPSASRILELGAGAGWQAKQLASAGHEVVALDIPSPSKYQQLREWPVTEYDGVNIPFPDASFDVVFSSNVMEHVVSFPELQNEIHRVLKPNGLVIHILPSASWRLVTLLMHYPWVVKEVMLRVSKIFRLVQNEIKPSEFTATSGTKLLNVLFPHRHGERGTAITELYFFSSRFWKKLFRQHNWRVEKSLGLGMLYSGYTVFGDLVSVGLRKKLAEIFGSSTQIYVLKKNK